MKRLLVLALPLCFSFSTCGRKGQPLPPFSFKPKAVNALKVEQVYNRNLLVFNIPRFFVDGRRIKDAKKLSYLVSVNFGRKRFPINSNRFLDEVIHPIGSRSCYNVRPIYDKRFKGEVSQTVCWVTQNPIEKVPDIERVIAGDGLVMVRFKAAKGFAIEVFRNGRFYKMVKSNVFVDREVDNGITYSYSFRYSRGNLRGRMSSSITLTPDDRIPPKSPRSFYILRCEKHCIFMWQPSASKDVVSYEIYFGKRLVANVKKGIYFAGSFCPNGIYYIDAVDKRGNRSKRITFVLKGER